MRTRGHHGRLGLFSAAAVLAASSVQAQAREITLMTRRSTAGGVAVELSGMPASACEKVASTFMLAGPSLEVPSVQTVTPCVHFAMPQSPLPMAEYCLEYDDGGNPIEASGSLCTTVTGVQADPAGATLTLGVRSLPSFEPDPASCVACADDATESACTRERGSWNTRITLGGIAEEIASTHLFAVATRRGAAPVPTPLDAAPQWFALSSELTRPLLVPVPDGDEESCVELYARPVGVGSDMAQSIARVCAQADGAVATRPARFLPGSAACESTYRMRWCRDNREDCEGHGPPRGAPNATHALVPRQPRGLRGRRSVHAACVRRVCERVHGTGSRRRRDTGSAGRRGRGRCRQRCRRRRRGPRRGERRQQRGPRRQHQPRLGQQRRRGRRRRRRHELGVRVRRRARGRRVGRMADRARAGLAPVASVAGAERRLRLQLTASAQSSSPRPGELVVAIRLAVARAGVDVVGAARDRGLGVAQHSVALIIRPHEAPGRHAATHAAGRKRRQR